MPSMRKVPGAWALVAVIVLASLGVMVSVSSQESAIMDELAHIPAGYGYVRYLDFRLNPEHPPLVKALAGIPLLFGGFNFPTEHRSWTTDINGQWDAGAQFFYFSGNHADRLIQLARFGPILLTLLLIIFVYRWSAELIGRRWALLPTLLVGLSPHVLAHGHYVTTDIAAVFGVVFATYYFIRLLHAPSRVHLIRAGVAFGVAQAGKFSAVLLMPYVVFLALAYGAAQGIRASQGMGWFSHAKNLFRYALPHLGRAIAIIGIGYVVVVYPLYGLFTLNYPMEKQFADTSFILTSFGGGPTPPGESCNPARCFAELNVWMTQQPLLRPLAEYMLGVLMVLQRSAGGNTNYFLGEVSAAGWHYYFPVVYMLKEPLPVVIMVLVALFGGLWGIFRQVTGYRLQVTRRFSDWLAVNFTEFAMITFVMIYWAYSIQSPLNIGFRHLFPTLPFIYILTAGHWKRLVTAIRIPQTQSLLRTLWYGIKAVFASSLRYLGFIFLVAWFVAETVLSYPYYLSYFNQLGGGLNFGYRYVTDSNYDWGQDLARLRTFVEVRNNDDNDDNDIAKIGVDYFGGGNPGYYLGARNENWWSSRGNPSKVGIHYLAVSVNTLQGATQQPVPGFKRNAEDEYRWLTDLRPPKQGMGNVPDPDYRVGTSLFVYKL